MSVRIHQLVHTLSYGDAISGEVFALQRCLRAAGHESEIYAINVHPRYKGSARDYRELATTFDGEVVLHYSLGSPLNELYRELRCAVRTVIYHNITPARWFEGVNSRIVADIRAGLGDLEHICRISDRVLADSSFNAEELRALGIPVVVLELPIDPARWVEPANAGIRSLIDADPRLHLLHVGRLAPNKRIEDIIKIFYFLHHHVRPMSKLWIVGIDIDTELYSFALKRMVAELRLDGAVEFTGGMSDGEVRAFYESCSAYVCMSEHEGFCLPVVEAMHFGLPVVAYGAGAVPDTIDAGGIVVREKRFPELALLLDRLYRDGEFRGAVVAAGRDRAATLSYGRFTEEVGRLFPFSRPESRAVSAS
jgi:glycosyltransferase involved in cell wall biosynthesis